MKAKFQKRTGGYTPELASNILDSSKPIHSLSLELEPQFKFEITNGQMKSLPIKLGLLKKVSHLLL